MKIQPPFCPLDILPPMGAGKDFRKNSGKKEVKCLKIP
jgi:hypothetical protein